MAGFLLGAGSGVLAGAAVYYTIAASIQQNTALLRAELANSNHVLQDSFDPASAPAASALVGPAYPSQTSFGQLLAHKWNNAVGAAVSGVRDANWRELGSAAVNAAQGAADRIGGGAAAAGDKAVAVAQSVGAATGAAVDSVKDSAATASRAASDAAADVAEKARIAKLKAETDVDAPVKPSPVITVSPKRLV